MYEKIGELHKKFPNWRRWRDSNPRYRKVQLISSQPRYDHFDTSPYFLQLQYLFLVRRDSWRELNAKTHFSNAICLRVAIDFTPGVLSYATWFRIRTLQPLGYISKDLGIIAAKCKKIKFFRKDLCCQPRIVPILKDYSFQTLFKTTELWYNFR